MRQFLTFPIILALMINYDSSHSVRAIGLRAEPSATQKNFAQTKL